MDPQRHPTRAPIGWIQQFQNLRRTIPLSLPRGGWVRHKVIFRPLKRWRRKVSSLISSIIFHTLEKQRWVAIYLSLRLLPYLLYIKGKQEELDEFCLLWHHMLATRRHQVERYLAKLDKKRIVGFLISYNLIFLLFVWWWRVKLAKP